MSKEKYVVYTLEHLSSYSRYTEGIIYTSNNFKSEFGWIPRYYTKEKLVHTIAYSLEVKGESDLLKNRVNDLTATRTEMKIDKVDYDFLGTRSYIHYNKLYFIGVIKKNTIENLDIAVLYSDIQKEMNRVAERRDKKAKEIAYHKRLNQYEFRRESVPCIGHRKWHRGCYYRLPQLGMVRKLNNTEDKEFNSNKYRLKNLPVWDDRTRHNDRSWKSSCKVKKQWMKHFKNHMDTEKYLDCYMGIE